MERLSAAIIITLTLAACGGKNTESNVDVPGQDKSGESKLLNTGAELLQDKSTLKAFNAYLDGFHFYNGNINAQMEAHHYVSQLNEDFHQAIIFDGNVSGYLDFITDTSVIFVPSLLRDPPTY
jgi:hypothetical protein